MHIVSIYNSTLYSSSTLLPAASTRFASVVSLSAFCQNLDRRLVQLLLRTQCSLRPLLCRACAVTRLQSRGFCKIGQENNLSAGDYVGHYLHFVGNSAFSNTNESLLHQFSLSVSNNFAMLFAISTLKCSMAWFHWQVSLIMCMTDSFFYRATSYASAVYASAPCPAVCLSRNAGIVLKRHWAGFQHTGFWRFIVGLHFLKVNSDIFKNKGSGLLPSDAMSRPTVNLADFMRFCRRPS